MHPLNVLKGAVVPFIMLSAFLFLMSGCAGTTTYADLMPKSFPADMKIQKVEGSVNVRTSVPSGTTNPTYVRMNVNSWLDNKKLKEAIEQTIVQYSVFSQVSHGSADYILDVWVETIQNVLDIGGEGFVFDMMSIWRVTRVKDGKVIVCEFVKGHGGANGFGSAAYPPGISASTRSMIQKGVFAISDQSQSHLSGMSTAGSRPSIAIANKN